MAGTGETLSASERVGEFNAKHPVRSTVMFRRADGVLVVALIRSRAEISRSGEPVVRLIGIAGPKSIDRIEAVR